MKRALLLLLITALAGCRSQPVPPQAPGEDVAAVTTGYDLIYALSHARPQPQPSPFLVATAGEGHGSTAVDIGSGAGRNTLYLARHGYRVTALDLSRIGLDITAQQAALGHLPVTTVAADIHQYDLGHARWDLVVLIDFPYPYQTLLPRIAVGLKPGGLVVIQAVSTREPGPRKSPDGTFHYTYMDRRDVETAFAGFKVLHDSEGAEPTVWGVKAVMIRFAARKPTQANR
ncbi:MAG: class I SAM-dependent methyltransferase [Terriglobales bacterium]